MEISFHEGDSKVVKFVKEWSSNQIRMPAYFRTMMTQVVNRFIR